MNEKTKKKPELAWTPNLLLVNRTELNIPNEEKQLTAGAVHKYLNIPAAICIYIRKASTMYIYADRAYYD